MDDRFNTAAGWVLFSGIVALGLTSVSSKMFKSDRPETMGYAIEVADAGGAEDSGPDLGTLLASADIAAGETDSIARCGTCHTFDQGGAAGTGPNLYGVMGKGMAGNGGFSNYSGALKEKGGTWTFEAMDEWILAPKRFVPGTTMSFAGLKDDQKRANILAYLNSLGSNLPLPEPVVAEEVAEESGEADDIAEADEAGAAEAEQDAAAETEAATE